MEYGAIQGLREGQARELYRLDWIEAGARVLLSTSYVTSSRRAALRRLLISPAISRIRESAADPKEHSA
jgi:hypothetical protein